MGTVIASDVWPSGGWQPIETAPKDGTPILVYNAYVGIYHSAYTTRWTGKPGETGYAGFPCGFWSTGPGCYPFGKWDCIPSHWMRLPDPPTAGCHSTKTVRDSVLVMGGDQPST
ncbi:MAG: hypothetical protein JWL62_3483 [Hyphomicrobiales bacterium]|nr:hypothetical protein [Hyphomicrobiales bacterium]